MAVRELLLTDPALEAEELDTGWRELQRAQRATLLSLRRDGVISEDVFEELTAEVDAQLSEGTPTIPGEGRNYHAFPSKSLSLQIPFCGETDCGFGTPAPRCWSPFKGITS